MNPSPGEDDSAIQEIIEENRELLEEIASWDEEKYPLAKYAQRILQNSEERSL